MPATKVNSEPKIVDDPAVLDEPPIIRSEDSSANTQVYVVPAGTIPLVPFSGIIDVNVSPSQ